ncbi:DNA-binding transcriptional response regulator, NtrC family, contains REC, AAA-type ATPase, and a Fis-type DNA-binding domains [Fibrobacter sp. UWB16]|uniref:sigma-54 interaction domain-containing protein n=1 Tax=unclassified Fibrobacter TaxID=2634177 RepID=UPI000B52821F|nr:MULTISPECIES: sigma-54 dependent transcriptional regulator [unclassified Fibrobacter]OWV19563.1 Fis family transcriptional regulator [Fibrobacter sp. UWB3]SOD11930.1 DNA-binding transcriptional response regulator, NtrC family, contains REC, AAA-type ATPase, and a Fis-type DNA-binding domains [Fibrobacter sp. UWB16]
MRPSIDFFTKETSTSSFILDVLSSVDNTVDVHTPISDEAPEIAEALRTPLAAIVIWDLDSFTAKNAELLASLRDFSPDSMILAYAESPESYTEVSSKLYDTILSVEALRLHLMSKIARLKEIYNAKRIFRERMSHLVGKSDAMQRLRKNVERAILHTGPVLIQGESGVGKDLVARAIACVYDKFVTVNCSAIPESLFESELFGHTRGAFTGAQNERIGLFEDANGGAIFLDEIGDMPLHAQVKLLRVIQNHEIRPIGANKTRHIDVRIIAATNRDLREEIREKRFREDLYYRLNVIPMQLSPLRDRKEDIEDLANYFIRQYSPAGEPYTLSPEALQKLQDHNWPGNIRELENVIQRALCFTDPGILRAEDLQIDESSDNDSASLTSVDRAAIKAFTASNYEEFRDLQLDEEREFLKSTIRNCDGSVSLAAERLRMNRTALYNRLTRLGLSVKNVQS